MEDSNITSEITSNIYYFNELYDILSKNEDIDDIVDNNLRQYNGETVSKNNMKKQTTNKVLDNIAKENVIKTKITQILNKLHSGNIPNVIKQLKDINYRTVEDLTELSNQMMNKIKRDNEQVKQIVGDIVYELLSINVVENNVKSYLNKIFMSICRREYVEVIENMGRDEYNRDRSEKIINMLVVLFNSNVIDGDIMLKIIEDVSKYMESENNVYVERSIQIFNIIFTTLIMNTDNKKMIVGFDKYFEENIRRLEREKRIGKMIVIMGENIIEKLRN
jgi:dGTP triphosphohydrolase